MKTSYPDYRDNKDGIGVVEAKLSKEDKKILERFLLYCGTTASDNKVKCRKYEILQVYDVIEKQFNKWNNDDLVAYLNLLKRANRKDWTRKCVLTTLGKFLKWHFEDWYKKFKGLEVLKSVNKQIKPNTQSNYSNLPTPQEIDLIIRKGKNTKERTYMSVSYIAGLPPIIAVNLKWSDVKIDFPEEGISQLTYFRGKNKQIVKCPLGATATYYLKLWKQEYEFPNVNENDYIFPQKKSRNKHINESHSWYWIKAAAKLANVTKPVYQYIFRHKTLSDSYPLMSETVHRQIYGHTKNSRMTEVYNHTNSDTSFNIALEQLHKVKTINPEQQNKYEREIAELKAKLIKVEEKEQKRDIDVQEIMSYFKKMGLLKSKIKNVSNNQIPI